MIARDPALRGAAGGPYGVSTVTAPPEVRSSAPAAVRIAALAAAAGLLATAAASALPAQDEALRYTILIDGERAGEEVAVREPAGGDAPERWHVRYEIPGERDAADLRAEALVDAATGLPVRLEVHGTDPRGREVAESFGLWVDGHPAAHPRYNPRPPGQDPAAAFRGAEAVRLVGGEERRQPVEDPVLYLPAHQTPTLRAITARALLAAPGGCRALLPEGRACIEEVTRVLLGPGFGPRVPSAGDRADGEGRADGEDREVVLYTVTVTGAGPGPNTGPGPPASYLWLEPGGTLFAELRGRHGAVRRGWEGALDWLARVQDPLESDRSLMRHDSAAPTVER